MDGVEQVSISRALYRIPSEWLFAFTPPPATDNFAIDFGDVIGPVVDHLFIDADVVGQCTFDLFWCVISPAEKQVRLGNQLLQSGDVVARRHPEPWLQIHYVSFP